MTLRSANLERIDGGLFDVLVVGAGINGAVSAASLAGRGANVALVDRGDFGAFTSQESSNLVWGGFKYLENYELPLVFGLCRSRNRLMKAYPDNIKEIGFLAALGEKSPYSPWFAALGATAYWGIGLFGTKRPHVYDAAAVKAEEPVIDTAGLRGGIQYQDAYLVDNDARFVFAFVRSALEAGAAVANYVEVVSAERIGDRWVVQLRDTDTGEELTTSARTVVNAAGPFVDDLNASGTSPPSTASSSPRASTSSSPASRPRGTTASSRSSTTPSGCSTSSRWAAARSSAPPTPASTARTPRSPTRTATSSSSRSTPASTCPSR